MKILRGSIKEDFSRDLYWTKIIFLTDDESKKTSVFACASLEYLEDIYCLTGGASITPEHLKKWADNVVKKWTALRDDILNQDVHYDVYANTLEGEANGLDFLLGKVQTS